MNLSKHKIMYQFKIKKQENGGYKFEFGAIKILVDDYVVKNGNHTIINPDKTIGYFNVNESLYGISNDPINLDTAEAFYDAVVKQYALFTGREHITPPPTFALPGIEYNQNIDGNVRR